jgi:hypothetical protein
MNCVFPEHQEELGRQRNICAGRSDPLAERLYCMDFETIHDHSESANENDNGDRGK